MMTRSKTSSSRSRKSAENAALQYARDVLDGRILAGRPVRLAAERFMRDLENAGSLGIFYNQEAAQHALDFYGFLRHSKGQWAGQVFTPLPWQQFIIANLFGWRKRAGGARRFRTAYVEVARKNGKSTYAAGLGLYLLCADGEPGAEVYTAACKRDQARIVHAEAIRMVAASPELRRRIGTFKDRLFIEGTASKFEPLGQDADTLDGLNLHGAALDELHAHKTRAMLDVLETATGARRQPLLICISAAGWDRNSLCWTMHDYALKVLEGVLEDETFFPYIASLDEGDDPMDEAVFVKANPNLGVSVGLESIREQAEKAKQVPSALNAFLRYRMNVWTDSHSQWLDMDTWDACSMGVDADELEGRECIGGLNLATTTDLTALVLLFPDEEGGFGVLPFFWIPEDNIRKRADRDRVPYYVWVREGLIKPTPGNVCDYDTVRGDIKRLFERFRIRELVYDCWNAS